MNRRAMAMAALLMSFSASAWAGCTLQTPVVSLGAYDPLNNIPPPVLVSVMVTCEENVVVTVSAGKGGSGNYATRMMARGRPKVLYNLYTGTTEATVWGDGTVGTGVVQRMVEPNIPTQFTGNARIYPGQNPVPGLYSDTLIFTATF